MATSDSPLSVPDVTLAVARQAGGGSPVSGFTAETGFALLDNGDGTLTITDSQARFGTKPNAAKPVWFFDFGSGSDQPHPTLSRQQKTVVWNSASGTSSAITKGDAASSVKMDVVVGGKGIESVFGGDGDKTLTLPANAGRKYFRYLDIYNDFTQPDLNNRISSVTGGTYTSVNLKANRWQSQNAQTTPYTPNVYQGGSYRFLWLGDSGGQYDTVMYDIGSRWATKQWEIQEEYHEVSSAAGATDANMYCVLDGMQVATRLNKDSHNGLDPSDPLYRWDHFKLANFEVWADPGYAPWYSNVLYVDDSWCRVYITDKPTWINSEVRALEIQIPLGWAAAQIDFQQRVGALGSFPGKYLWVADNDDNKILIGGWV